MAYTIKEEQDSAGKSDFVAGFSDDDCRSTRSYRVKGAEAGELSDIIIDIVGATDLQDHPGNLHGAIFRTVPKNGPSSLEYSYFARRILNIRGHGKKIDTNTPVFSWARQFGTFLHYPEYSIEVEFEKVLMSILPDDKIGIFNSAVPHFPADGSAGFNYRFAEEWLRYTWWTETPSNNFVSATVGGSRFRTTDPAKPAPQLNGTLFQDTPKLYLPDSIVQCKWYNVPYRYLTDQNSYLKRFIGRINEHDFMNYPPGSLLYLGPNPEVKMPMIQTVLDLISDEDGLDQTRMMDVTLNFLYTQRVCSDPPGAAEVMFTSNKNRLPFGHNLFPNFLTRKFHYVTAFDGENTVTAADQTKWEPFIKAIPFQMLFTDPQTLQLGSFDGDFN
jgi:hypothetical protein